MTEKQFNKYDVFRSFLVENCNYDGFIELPVIKTSNNLPEKIVTFSTAMKKSYSDFDAWVAFYEYDRFFERFWNNPKRYLAKLKNSKELYHLILVCTEICHSLCKCGTLIRDVPWQYGYKATE